MAAARNIEIKAHLRDADNIKSKVLNITGLGDIRIIGKIIQYDKFYRANFGRLKLRHFEDGTGELIAYDRSNISGPKLSTYTKVRTEIPYTLNDALNKSLGIIGEIKNERFVYIVGQTRVHIDKVEGLGNFIELEVVLNSNQTPEDGKAIADKFMELLNIEKKDLIEGAYFDMKYACGHT